MYERIIKVIEENRLAEALEQVKKIPDDKWEKYNFLGLILLYQQNFSASKEAFEKALEKEPVNDDLLFNYSQTLLALGEEMEAWRYLMRINEKDWAVYDILGDIEYKNRSKASAIKFYKKAYEKNPTVEMKEKLNSKIREAKQNTKIAIFCLPGLENFIQPIAKELSHIYEVKFIVSNNQQEIHQGVLWADIVWIEWANDLAVFMTNKINELKKKVVFCRLHGYESLNSAFLNKINWEFINKMIYVADHVREDAFKTCPKLKSIESIMLYNGIDLDRFRYDIHEKGNEICFVGNLNYKKNPMLFIQILFELLKTNDNFKFHWIGNMQDIRISKYLENILNETGYKDKFLFSEWSDNIDEWLENKNYFLSTSIHEGYGVAIMEAMAKGIKPIIHNFYQARGFYPEDLIFNNISEAVKLISENEYSSERYRRFIEDNYCFEEKIFELENLIENNYRFQDKIRNQEMIFEDFKLSDLQKKSKKIKIKNDLFANNKELQEIFGKMEKAIPYSISDINKYNFKEAEIMIGRRELINKQFEVFECILNNSEKKKLLILNIWFDRLDNTFILPRVYSESKNREIVLSLLIKIMNKKVNYNNNIAGFIYDKDIMNDYKNNKSEYIWERVMPGTPFGPLFNYLKAFERYLFASKFIRETDLILEAPSGFGYGAAFFSNLCSSVEALDISKNTLQLSKQLYSNNPVNWRVGDITSLPYEENYFDLYTSFEVFEHLEIDTLNKYLSEAYRVLKNGGRFLISTPNIEMRRHINNPFHIKEYTYEEFNGFLGKIFDNIEFYSVVNYKVEKGMDKKAHNMLAVCTK